ncbi:MAG: histidine--tRNA ligase [Patescibacteria group bacterium]
MPKTVKKPAAPVKPTAEKPVKPTGTTAEEVLPKPKRTAPAPNLLRGMKDILPGDQKYWALVRGAAEHIASSFGFDRVDTPVLEETALFVRGVGKQTDIVEKEMFSFVDQGGESMTLRPELTAPLARAYINHGMWNHPQPIKWFTWGQVFRHERPQAGRYRQFTQAGLDVFGDRHPVIDANLIFAAYSLFKDVGLDAVVMVNSIGDAASREAFKEQLVTYYRSKRSHICENCKKRLQRNPMRVLDCKEEGCAAVKAEAPQIVDFLNEESKNHFIRVLEYLDELEVPYQLQPHLVRGLDYYGHTVFEVVGAEDADKPGSQTALAAGGRYDALIETLGGQPTAACGFSWGIERVILRLKEKQVAVQDLNQPEVFVAQLGEPARRKTLALFNALRKDGVKVAESFSRDALKQQLEIANRMGVRFTVILGQKEVLDGTALIRDMDSGIQEILDFKKCAAELKRKLAMPAPPKAPPPPAPAIEDPLLAEEPLLKEEEPEEPAEEGKKGKKKKGDE